MTTKVEEKNEKPICLLVLGPHRSGTSALSGVLSLLGADLPKNLMVANEGNSVGYFESSSIMHFNDRFLKSLGSSWHDTSPIDIVSIPNQVYESFMNEAVEILGREFSDARIPLLKDPRICRFVGFWSEAFDRFGYRSIYIHTHRNPLEMAQSLAKRHPISVEKGLLIWLRHVLDAEAATRGEIRAFTNYKALLANWRMQVSKIEKVTDFTFLQDTAGINQEVDTFLSSTLRHQNVALEDVSKSPQVANIVREAFDIFESWENGLSKPEDYLALDRIRQLLNESMDQVGIFINALEREQKERKSEQESIRKEVERWSQENRELTQAIETLHADKASVEENAKLEEQRLQESLNIRDGEVYYLKADIQERFDELARVSIMMLKSQKRLEAAEQASEALQLKIGKMRQKLAESRRQVEALLSSTSWKITGPLRRLIVLLRR